MEGYRVVWIGNGRFWHRAGSERCYLGRDEFNVSKSAQFYREPHPRMRHILCPKCFPLPRCTCVEGPLAPIHNVCSRCELEVQHKKPRNPDKHARIIKRF